MTVTIPIGRHLPLKTKQPYIYGKTGVGKSHIVISEPENDPPLLGLTGVVPHLKVYLMQPNGNMVDYDDNIHHMLWYDEFELLREKEHMNIPILNSLLSGEERKYWQMFGSVHKRRNKPFLITSNLHPAKAIYKLDPDMRDAFLSRLDVYQMLGPATVTWHPDMKKEYPKLLYRQQDTKANLPPHVPPPPLALVSVYHHPINFRSGGGYVTEESGCKSMVIENMGVYVRLAIILFANHYLSLLSFFVFLL